MAWRAEFGNRNGVFGAWVSKPGIDVTTAAPGQFLLDTSSQIFQCVLAGDTLMAQNPTVGNFVQTVPLPANFGAFSRIVMWAHLYELNLNTGAITWDDNFNGRFDGLFRTGGGVLTLTLISTVDYSATGVPPTQLRIAWSIFRAVF